MLAVTEVPEAVIGRAEPEDAEDIDEGGAVDPKSMVASCAAAVGIVRIVGPG